MTRRRRLVSLGIFLVLVAGVSVYLTGARASRPGTKAAVGRPAAAPSAPTPSTTACTNSSVLAKWPTGRLALLTVVVPAEETNVSAARSEVRSGVGGLILFGSEAPPDLAARLRDLEKAVPGHRGLLVMTDEEGGGVQRMANLVGSLPWPRTMAASWSPAQIEAHVEKVGRRMRAAGVLMDLAPVLDVDGRDVPPGPSDPDGWRSFSGRTAVVARDGLAYMKGLMAAGVLPVVKHFPGLGGASGNTDVGPAHTLPWARLKKVALPTFEAAIANKAPAVMVSNATVPGLAADPASLSRAAISGELVRKLGFKGLIITDSLSAKAISAAGFDVPSASVAALRAGADMVLYNLGSTTAATLRTADMIEQAVVVAVRTHKLERSRLVAAARAVLAVRHVSLCG